MSWKEKLLVMTASGALLGTLTACGDGGWQEGHRYGKWRLAYHGYGMVTGDDREVLMYPTSATDEDTTHACLVVTDEEFEGDIDFSVTVRTEEQVRQGEPNTWEVGWVLWDYQDDEHFYALALKPNGWELSKQDPDYRGNQRFLMSGHEPRFPVNQDYRARIVQVGNTITVFADGVQLGEFTDTETPYHRGSIGLYTEDAKVRFSDLEIESAQSAD
ncbi:family 16 glycoside hydrolase [Corynebacterium hylobatis]|nr:family 16 glycoside hydrolase [Corynebacterium hylobatis]